MRSPSLPQVFVVAVACLVLGFGIGDWWNGRGGDDPNEASVGFFDDMTTHHLQAVDMVEGFLRGADDTELIGRAEEIMFSQAGDIRIMQNALSEWGEQGSPDVAMDWMGMSVPQDEQPGMATDAEMAELETARGRELDDLFTRLMIEHHAGGADMADAAAARVNLDDVQEFAEGMATVQRREIDELNHARLRLGLPIVDV